MDSKTEALYKERARIIKAMSHPTRLFIVDLLHDGEKCVNELTEKIDADISTVSRHLSTLKNAGIVTDRKHGTQVYYILRCPCVLNFITCVESVIRTTAADQMKLVTGRKP